MALGQDSCQQTKRRGYRGLLAAWGLVGLLCSAWASAETLMAGPSGAPMSIDEALHTAKDGDTIELLPGEYTGTVLIEGRRLTLRGVGSKTPVITGQGQIRQGHALWTVRGGEVTLENLEFRASRSSDGGGAGLRQEGGQLSIVRCNFYDNEHGLVATNDPAATLSISGSGFGAAPKVVGGLFHLLNVGRIGKFTVTGSRFQQGFEGHLIKTRARENVISYNFIHDGVHGGASYEVEIANGGVATVIGNVIAQGVDGRNPVMLAYGSEGPAWDKNELYVAHNTFITYGWTPAWFIRVFSDRVTGELPVYVINNLLVGPGMLWPAVRGHLDGNRFATRGMLRDIWTYGLELPSDSVWRGSGVDPRNINGHDLSPRREFDWATISHELSPDLRQWTPGAFQR